VQAEGLTKTYGTVRALDGLDLQIAPGTVTGLLGPNGAGKTTAVRDGLTVDALAAFADAVERARVLAQAGPAGQGRGRLLHRSPHDVWERARAYGADSDDQAAAFLHDIVEDAPVTDEDLWA